MTLPCFNLIKRNLHVFGVFKKRHKNDAFNWKLGAKLSYISYASFESNTKTHQSLSSAGLRKLQQESVSVLSCDFNHLTGISFNLGSQPKQNLNMSLILTYEQWD